MEQNHQMSKETVQRKKEEQQKQNKQEKKYTGAWYARLSTEEKMGIWKKEE